LIFEKKMNYYTEIYFKKVLLGEPHGIIGKKCSSGITEEFINHVVSLLKRYRIIKVKALKSVANKSNIKDIASQVSERSHSYLLDLRGRTFILSKKPIKKP